MVVDCEHCSQINKILLIERVINNQRKKSETRSGARPGPSLFSGKSPGYEVVDEYFPSLKQRMAGLGMKVKRPKCRMGLIPVLNPLNESMICYTLLLFSPIFC